MEPQQQGGSAFNPPTSNLRHRVVRGAIVTYASQTIRMATQFVSVVVMSRLLAPVDFGLIAMVAPIYGLALMLQDLGLTQTTIQRPQITLAQITALFWINVAASAGLALLLALLAPLVGWFYGDARVANLTRGFAALILISGLAAQHLALINRRMRFHYLAVLDVVSLALGVVSAISLAILLRSYWALFALPLVTTLTTAVGAWAGSGFVPGRPRRERDLRDLLHMGGGIAGFNIFNFIARNLDNVLIGHAWGDAALGLYDRAYKLLLFPLQQINAPLARVMMPTLARLQHDPVNYRIAYLRSVQMLLLVTQPGIVFTIATADTLVPVLLGEQWRAVAPIFQWLGIAALQQSTSASTGWLFVSQGRSQEYMHWGAFNAATSTAAFFAGLPWGPVGVAAAYSITQIFPRMPVLWWMATRRGPVRLRDLYGTVIPHVAATGASFLAIIVLRPVAALGPIPGLVACLFASYAAAFLLLALTVPGRATLRQSITLVVDICSR